MKPGALHPGHYATVPNALLSDPQTKPVDIAIYAAISSYMAWTSSKKLPSRGITNREIKQRSGVKTWRTLYAAIGRLEDAGYIAVLVRVGNERGNEYTLKPTPGGVTAETADTAQTAGGVTAETADGVTAISAPKHRANSSELQEARSTRSSRSAAASKSPQTKTKPKPTEAQTAAATAKAQAKRDAGYPVKNLEAFTLTLVDDFDEDGNDTTTGSASPATYAVNATSTLIAEAVAACDLCDDRGLVLDPDYPGETIPLTPTIRCQHNEQEVMP